MLKAISPPTTANLMALATVQAALGLPDSELANLTRQVKAVSGLVAGYLRFVPGYGVWEETVTGARGPVLDLSARRVVPWLPEVYEHVAEAAAAHARLPRPDWAGRRIAMPR